MLGDGDAHGRGDAPREHRERFAPRKISVAVEELRSQFEQARARAVPE